MKTDVIRITGSGEGIDSALLETEKAAEYRGLGHKQALRLRLLAEEMTGMLRTIVGDENEYTFWIENTGLVFRLHLATEVLVDRPLHDELLKASTSGKNAAAKGFMGRLKDILLRLREPGGMIQPTEYGYAYIDICEYDPSPLYPADAMCEGWSLKAYRSTIGDTREEEPERWDELEKSITANLADDISIFIRGDSVEMVVEKSFE